MTFLLRCAVASVLVVFVPFSAWADEAAGDPVVMPDVVVRGLRPGNPDSGSILIRDRQAAPAADGGDLLRSVNGVSAGRMGGRGLDPVVRGQGQGRINVLLDGAYIFGACPNRMDPPSSFAVVETWDAVTVLRGVSTLLWGGGGSGGTVLFERDAWPDATGVTGRGGASSTSNGTHYLIFGDLAFATDERYFSGRVQTVEAGNYRDGDGNAVRSAYEERALSLEAGTTFTGTDRLELAADLTRGEDFHYAGAGMDAPKDDADSYRMKYRSSLGKIDLRAEGWYSKVHHLMDNYSVRTLTTPMAMRVPARTTTAGGRLRLDVPVANDWTMTAAVDYLFTGRHATRYQGPAPDQVNTVNSYLWPDANVRDTGVTVEAAGDAGGGQLTLGLRYDRVDADADKARSSPAGAMLLSPDELYRAYYGPVAVDEEDDRVSLLVRYERSLTSGGPLLFTGFSRTVRTADATERYMAANSPMDPSSRWVGNPGLDPEDHRQLDFGLSWGRERWQVLGAVFYDRVRNYITPDRARGQPGILRDDGARIYRNVAAEFVGAELEGWVALGNHWRLEASAAYVRAENTDDNRPLPQIPPLNGRLQLSRHAGNWEGGVRLRWADRQSRVDDDPTTGSGLDAGETPGHGVLDIFSRLGDPHLGDFRVGVDNLLDKTWADHLNRANQDPFNPDPVQVNEPGRILWVNWSRDF